MRSMNTSSSDGSLSCFGPYGSRTQAVKAIPRLEATGYRVYVRKLITSVADMTDDLLFEGAGDALV